MKRFMDSQKPLIEIHGLLPGITVAFFIVLVGMLALVSASWLAVGLVVLLIVAVTVAVVWVVMQVADDEDQPQAR